MKISIITPSNNPKYLKELEDSILANTYQDWEWILLLNNGAEYSATDSRIRIVECPFVSDSVGALKKYACSLATGEIIAEVDHDDMITEDCLEEVNKAFEDPEIGFAYSDCAKLPMHEIFRPYLAEFGWTFKKYTWKGKNLFVMQCQPLVPEKLGFIWYAPDHIRAWRKTIYNSIGGHNENLVVCDDQDLMHRLYLITHFKFIDKVLYIYRITGGNTWLKKCDLIQSETIRIYNENIEALRKRYAELQEEEKVTI